MFLVGRWFMQKEFAGYGDWTVFLSNSCYAYAVLEEIFMGVIQSQVACSSAKDFLDALFPLGAYFKGIKVSKTWLFRGQGQHKPLIPSAFGDRLPSRRGLTRACSGRFCSLNFGVVVS
jgi:hypothetical protein